MKVFVTGCNGYIGTHLVNILKENGHFVTGCDLNLYEDCRWEESTSPDQFLRKDIRNLEVSEVAGHDVIMHLAAISNDPMGDLDEDITYSINLKGSVHVAKLAKAAGIQRFLFAGSCSVYGKGEKLDLDENASLNPVSAYAISKVQAEAEISKMADDKFSPTFLRNSTAYGYSPMLRIDLVVNNLLACAFTQGNIKIMSDGTPWRPLIHCKDIASAFFAFSTAPIERIHNKSINIGANSENYQVKDVAELVKRFIPDAEIIFTGEIGEDPRNYRVNFDLLREVLPNFRLEYTLFKGMEELFSKYKANGFSIDDFNGYKFVRLRALKRKIKEVAA